MKDTKNNIYFILRSVVLPFTALLTFTALLLWLYGLKVGEASEKRVYRLLSESANAQRVAMDERKKSTFQQLDIIANALGWDGNINSDKGVSQRLQNLAKESVFENAAVADLNGKLLYQNGTRSDCSDRSYFKDAVRGELSTQYLNNGRMSGNSVFVFSSKIMRIIARNKGIRSFSTGLPFHHSPMSCLFLYSIIITDGIAFFIT